MRHPGESRGPPETRYSRTGFETPRRQDFCLCVFAPLRLGGGCRRLATTMGPGFRRGGVFADVDIPEARWFLQPMPTLGYDLIALVCLVRVAHRLRGVAVADRCRDHDPVLGPDRAGAAELAADPDPDADPVSARRPGDGVARRSRPAAGPDCVGGLARRAYRVRDPDLRPHHAGGG